MNYRSVWFVAVRWWVLLNLTAFTAGSQAPTLRQRELGLVFAAKPDDLESGERGRDRVLASRRTLCWSGQVE